MTNTELNNYLNDIDKIESKIITEKDIYEFSGSVKLSYGWAYNITTLHNLLEAAADLIDYKVSIKISNNVIRIFIQGFIEYQWYDDGEYETSQDNIWERISNKKEEEITEAIIEFEETIEETII